MMYSTVEIRPNLDDDKWSVSFCDLDGDREDESSTPSALGFYHYPRDIGRTAAFEKLRQHMVDRHNVEIERLTKSRDKLLALRFTEPAK